MTHAASEAAGQAHSLAGTSPDPDMPLSGYLQPLQSLTAAVVSAGATMSRLADMAVLTVIDPWKSADADHELKKAERLAHLAGEQLSIAFSEVRRALRYAGHGEPSLEGVPRLRRYKDTAAALADLSARAEHALALHSELRLDYLPEPIEYLNLVLTRLGQSASRLRAGIDHAHDQLPEKRPGSPADRVHQAAENLMKAAGAGTRGGSEVREALDWQRKQVST